ncbi:Hypothetical_protein [Hexamita inflata]|uniref:Hypothetical_protein n=1 Tax=Hexamita inflata TaxID=28002 RepID=A0AA86Q9U6_9EUKA|nr:Hypothetical protein HINF_LOCUS42680 [Hexamita inflata]
MQILSGLISPLRCCKFSELFQRGLAKHQRQLQLNKRKTFQMNLRKICLRYVFKLHALDIQQTLRMRYFMLKQYCLFTDSMKFVDQFKLIEQLEITLFVAYVIFSHRDQETRFLVK